MIQVRKVQPSDIELLLKNSEKLSFNKAVMLEKLDNMMIVINGSEICGIGCGIAVEDACLLNWIFIVKEHRRDRLGTALVKTILNNAELNGAKTAYISGRCDGFASFLKFDKIEDMAEIKRLDEIYESVYRECYEHNFYKVSLIDYFKPCCG